MRVFEDLKIKNVLFGMAKKPISTRASRWARRTEFLTFPGERYNGWNSFWPVAFEANVLSLPRSNGTTIDPWVSGSSLMAS